MKEDVKPFTYEELRLFMLMLQGFEEWTTDAISRNKRKMITGVDKKMTMVYQEEVKAKLQRHMDAAQAEVQELDDRVKQFFRPGGPATTTSV